MKGDKLPRNRRTGAFERPIATFLAARVDPHEPLVVACSGGPDSVAALVATSRARAPGHTVAACFDHRIRPSEVGVADAAFVADLAASLGAAFVVGAATQPLVGDEHGARLARYRWLLSACREAGARFLVTGHTEDDQAETVLLHLARGAGLRGAAAMAAVSPWPVDDEAGGVGAEVARNVLRPLLDRSRTDVVAYLDALGLTAQQDETNEARAYARNRVRHDVLPALEAVNPRVRRHLAEFASRAREADDALERWAGEAVGALVAFEGGQASLDRRRLGELPPAVARRVVRLAAARAGIALDAVQTAAILEAARRRGAHLDLAGGSARTNGSTLFVSADPRKSGSRRGGERIVRPDG